MKKTRWLAGVLCVMMVCTMIPMLASATTTTWDSIDDIMDGAAIPELDWDMTSADYQTGLSFYNKPTTHTADGADLSTGNLRYPGGTSWSPLADGKALYFQLKVTGTGDIDPNGGTNSVAVFIHAPGTEQNNYGFRLNADGIVNPAWVTDKITYNSGFAPGTGYVEYLMLGDTEGNYQLYAKKEEDAAWTLAIEGFGYSPATSTTYGIMMNTTADCGAYLKKLAIYTQATAPETVDQVMGKTMYVEQSFDLTSTAYQSIGGFHSLPTEHDPENGANVSTAFRYAPSAGYSPLTGGNVFTFKAKAAGSTYTTVYVHDPATENKTYAFRFNNADVTTDLYAQATIVSDPGFVPGDDWVEFLVMDTGSGIKVYGKNASTENKWEFAFENSGYCADTSATYGLMFFSAGYIKEITVYTDTEPEDDGGDDGEGGGGTTPEVPPVVPPTTPEIDENLHDSIEAVVGSGLFVDQEFNYTKENAAELYTVVYQDGATFSTDEGLVLKNGTYWRYTPVTGYSPIAEGKAVYFRARVPDNSTKLTTYIKLEGDLTELCYSAVISAAGISTLGANAFINTAFVPGTDWADYLAIKTEAGFDLYASSPAMTGSKWVQVLVGTGTTKVSNNCGVYFISAGGNSYVKEMMIYTPSGTSPAGSTYTDEELFGALIQKSNKKLTFDADFDGTAENAGAKNVATGEDLTPYTIGADGLELANTGENEYFAWNYGTENAWQPLTASSSVVFRTKLEAGSELGVKLNGGSAADITITPTKIALRGVLGKTGSFVPGTDWVTYMVVTEGMNINLYARRDGETNWTLAAMPDRFFLGGYYGVLLNNPTSSKAIVEYIEQTRLEKPRLTSPEEIVALRGTTYLDEKNPESSYDLTDIDPKEQWYIRTKATLTGADGVSGAFRNNGKQLLWTLTPTGLTVGDEGATETKPLTLATNTQYEILFAYYYNVDVTIYIRKAGDEKWTKTHSKFVTTSAKGMDDITLTETAGSIDSIKLYQGDYFGMSKLAIEGGSYLTEGEYFYGTPDSAYARRATLITAAYDKVHGYTTFAEAKDYEAEGGFGVDLTNSFVASGISAGENSFGAMLWDTIKGIPLAEGVGVMAENNATGKPATGQKAELTTEERYNSVRITGYTGGAGTDVIATLTDGEGNLKGVIQAKANEYGMVDTEVAVDPALLKDTYTLLVQYGTAAAVTDTVTLYGEEIPYNEIDSASDMKSFITNYGSENAKKWNSADGFAADVYARFAELKGDTEEFTDLYDFREVMDAATDAEVRERELCKGINDAAKIDKWTTIQSLLMEVYAEDLGISDADIAGIVSKKNLFLRMEDDYTSTEEVLEGFREAVKAQRKAEEGNGSGGGGGAGGGGGGGFIVPGAADKESGNAFNNDNVDAESVKPNGESAPLVEKPADFDDLTSVAWAEPSIKKMRGLGIINGDGDGKFHPNRAVTREEFLKMAMIAAGIAADGTGAVSFADVDAEAWYYPYVAAAYEAGIIQGMSEEYFGIGQQITRADMAVMLERILAHQEIALDKVRPANIFKDFDTIPQYARESISLLYETGLLNGIGDNEYMAEASATRAESAVAIFRVYEYIEERR